MSKNFNFIRSIIESAAEQQKSFVESAAEQQKSFVESAAEQQRKLIEFTLIFNNVTDPVIKEKFLNMSNNAKSKLIDLIYRNRDRFLTMIDESKKEMLISFGFENS